MRISNQQLTLREIQLVELGILKRLTKYFKKNHINYILCGGTLLGAVRHKGFIPWDDDIDILVPRDDYEKLKTIYRNGNDDIEGVKLTIPGDKGSPHPFIKANDENYVVLDDKREEEYRAFVWVDVFPMDHFPDDEKTHKKWVNKIHILTQTLSFCTVSDEYLKSRGYYSNLKKKLIRIAIKTFCTILGGPAKVAIRIDQTAKEMNARFRNSGYVGDGAWPSGMKDYFPLDAVEPIMKHKFEDSEFNIPVNYDKYLTLFYGDYMTIPPEDKRQDHHITVYRVEL